MFLFTFQSLRINNDARKATTVGQIVNLMSVDAQRFQDVPVYMHMIWSAPFNIALAIYFLWQELGPSALAGLAVMLVLAPINVFVGQKTRTLQVSRFSRLIFNFIMMLFLCKFLALQFSWKNTIFTCNGLDAVISILHASLTFATIKPSNQISDTNTLQAPNRTDKCVFSSRHQSRLL